MGAREIFAGAAEFLRVLAAIRIAPGLVARLREEGGIAARLEGIAPLSRRLDGALMAVSRIAPLKGDLGQPSGGMVAKVVRPKRRDRAVAAVIAARFEAIAPV